MGDQKVLGHFYIFFVPFEKNVVYFNDKTSALKKQVKKKRVVICWFCINLWNWTMSI